MITAEPGTALAHYCKIIDDMKPGQWIDLPMALLDKHIVGLLHNGAHFNPADRICENIVDSGRTIEYWLNDEDMSVTFAKYEPSEIRRYTSPDRR